MIGADAVMMVLNLLDDFLAAAQDEAVAGQFLKGDAEILLAGQGLVLAPVRISLVLGLHIGPGVADGFLVGGGDVHFLDDGHFGGHFPAAGGQPFPVDGGLPFQRGQSGVGIDEPGQAQFPGAAHHGVKVGRHPDGRVWLLHGADGAGGVVQVEMPPVMGNLILRPQPPHQFQRLQKTAHPVAALHIERLVLNVPVAQAHAQHHPSVADDIQGGDGFGDIGRSVEGQEEDGQHQPHIAGIGGQAGQQGDALQVLVGRRQEMLAAGNGAEAGIARQAGQFHRLVKPLGGGIGGRVLGHRHNAEFHGERSVVGGMAGLAAARLD